MPDDDLSRLEKALEISTDEAVLGIVMHKVPKKQLEQILIALADRTRIREIF